MKTLVLSLVFVFASVFSFACDLDGLMRGNTTLAKQIKKYERQGYEVVIDQSFYNQHRYIVAPTAPYTDGFGTVVLRKSGTNYSLETTYVHINFEGNVKNNGQCSTSIIDITTNTVY